MGNAMTKTEPSKLDKLRPALLQLHRALLDAQRIRYERDNGRVESRGELLELVLEDASFEWLRVLSALIARLDELAASDDRDASTEMRGVIDKLRAGALRGKQRVHRSLSGNHRGRARRIGRARAALAPAVGFRDGRPDRVKGSRPCSS
jgi:hypothetical protein